MLTLGGTEGKVHRWTIFATFKKSSIFSALKVKWIKKRDLLSLPLKGLEIMNNPVTTNSSNVKTVAFPDYLRWKVADSSWWNHWFQVSVRKYVRWQGTWVWLLISAKVIMSQFMGLSPASDSVLIARSLLGIVSLSLPLALCPFPAQALSLWINK